jgi:hypothetical protein
MVISPNVANNSHYALNNIDNYNGKIEISLHDILHKQTNLIVEYLHFISENTKIKTIQYNKFLLIRGLETITHVFNMILYYTKNIDVAFYHSQKAFYFYVEFIEQITDEKHTFLNLNSRDASLFVYKKTIFDVNQEYRKHMQSEPENEIIDILFLHSKMIKNILLYFFEKKEFIFNKDHLQNIIQKTDKFIKEIHIPLSSSLLYSILTFLEKVDDTDNNILEQLNIFISTLS